jgi:1-acyl-sn-glycerol-3-phosphate acyltransferase
MPESAPETGARVIPITSAASRRQDAPEAGGVTVETPAPAKEAPAKKTAAKKTAAKRAPAKKTPAKKAAARKAPAGDAAEKTPAKKAPAKKTAAKKAPAAASPAAEQPAPTPGPTPESPHADVWERQVAGGLAFLRRRLTGEYEIDEFGFDRDLTENVLAAPFRPLYEKYWRVEVLGLENVPSDGSALVVGNHSGTMAALDAVMVQLALLDEHPAHRHLRMLGADLVFSTPFVGELARKSGSTLACNADAERLLREGHVVGVWPEGFKGIGKPFSERYKLQRFGRGGFVSAALKTGAPIVPVSIVGAEEIYPMLGNAKTLARVLGLPYFPLTPTFPWLGPLGLVPLPSKWLIEFGTPIETAHLVDQADDPMLVFNLTDQVRETIQQTLYRLLLRRESVFS